MTETHDCPICSESFDSHHGMRIHRGTRHELPHKDEDVMRRLYVDKQMSIPEIADELDAGTTTIESWLDKHGIDTRDRGGKPDDAAYKDEDLLRELYREEDLTRVEIADRLDCSEGDVRYRIEKYGIEKDPEPWHDPETLREKCEEENIIVPELAEMWDCGETTIYYHLYKHDIERPRFAKEYQPQSNPYKMIHHREDGEKYLVLVHRLVACAHGMIEPSEVWGSDTHIHHKNGIPWINSPENLEPVTPEEHQQIHASGSSEKSVSEY